MDPAPRKPYRTDLTDDQWGLLATVLPPAKPGGRPRTVDLREVVNAMLDLGRFQQVDPKAKKALLGDGNYGGLYQRSDEDMLAIWRVAMAHKAVARAG